MKIKEAYKLIDLLRNNNLNAYRLLREKASGEHMTLIEVLIQWGDPREWQASG